MTAPAKSWTRDFHYWASALLALTLIPLLKRLDLPTKFNWAGLAYTFWVVLAGQSIFIATLLYVIEFPTRTTLRPLVERFQRERLRIPLLLAFMVVLGWALGWLRAWVLTVDTVAVLEVRQRLKPTGLGLAVRAILPPALYLFAGLLLVSAYNDIILSVRFFAATDVALNSMDEWLLGGMSVARLCHWALQVLPLPVFQFLEFIYFGMFPVVGAGLILICQHYGRHRGMQFVGAILTAYYLALVIFYLWPSQGPYYLCPGHFSQFPSSLKTYAAQKGSVSGAEALWKHLPPSRISFDYYIALPCMHIVQPLIVMWFLRHSKNTVYVLSGYSILLAIAIVLLEWHYVVDVLAGVLVAIIAIIAVDGRDLWRRERSAQVAIAKTHTV
ncbi:MAG: phosphatase PAP2 family protein [Terriglobales bacterium]